jgi:FkbM family methyltransferase
MSWQEFKRRGREFLLQVPYIGDLLIGLYRYFRPAPYPMRDAIAARLRGRRKLFFLQVGANDGVMGDPLRDLLLKNRGWEGIFVEPVGFLFRRLRRNYRAEPRFIFENVAISSREGQKTFYFLSEQAGQDIADLPTWTQGLGSFQLEHLKECLRPDLWPYISEEQMTCVPLASVLEKHNVVSIDLLLIDTEGYDFKVLSQVDFQRYRPLVIVYEHHHLSNGEREQARELLQGFGYHLREIDGDTLALSP